MSLRLRISAWQSVCSLQVLNSWSADDCVQIGLSAEVDKELTILRERVMLELRLQTELQQIQGMLEPILAASAGAANPVS